MRSATLGVLLFALVAVSAGLTGAPQAQASPAYDAVVDLTFPVAGSPATFIDDYDQCRGGSGCPRRHRATDIMAPYGAKVHAAVGGTISFITGIDAAPPSYGYMIAIRGDDGRTYNYIHLGDQKLGPEEAYAPGMARGVRVERGQHIGFNGHSGNAHETAPHLHFEIVDPAVTDPYGTHRMNPYASLVAARQRGDVPGAVSPAPSPTPSPGPSAKPAPEPAPAPEPQTNRFVDVGSDNVHRDTIEWLAEQRITLGCNPPTNDRFCPSGAVTRQQMAAFLVRALALEPGDGRTFSDVPAGSTFADDIDRLATAGITVGCNPPANDRFCPTTRVTRQQTASFFTRAFDLPPGSATFTDVAPRSTHAESIASLAAAGVTRGCNPPTNDRFCPGTDVTRAQFASLIKRAVDL